MKKEVKNYTSADVEGTHSMEINITLLTAMNCFDLSHSIAEGGEGAPARTWKAAQAASVENMLLDTPEKRAAFVDWVEEFGAWSRAELEAMSPEDLNALLLQWVASDVREAGADTLGEVAWADYEENAAAGQNASNMFKAENGEIFFSLCR